MKAYFTGFRVDSTGKDIKMGIPWTDPAGDHKEQKVTVDTAIGSLSSFVMSQHNTSASSVAPSEFKQQVMCGKRLAKTLTSFAKETSSITHTELAEMALHHRQALYETATKNPKIYKCLTSVITNYQKQASEAKMDPNFINMVTNELGKIRWGNHHKAKEKIQSTGRRICLQLTEDNKALATDPSDELIKKIGRFINAHLAWLHNGSIESTIIGKESSKQILAQLGLMRKTLRVLPTVKKLPLAQKLEALVTKILPMVPERIQISLYRHLPIDALQYHESLATIRKLIDEDPTLGYECLAAWISTSRIHINWLELTPQELEKVVPHLTHVTIDEIEGWGNAEYNHFIDSCKNLTSLSIHVDTLTELTAKRVEKLQHLQCARCPLQALPDGMTALESLNCHGCPLKSLPAGLSSLQSLDCTLCSQLKSLPLGLNALRSLRCYRCEGLISLSKNLDSLETLNIMQCRRLRASELSGIAPQLKSLCMGQNGWDDQAYHTFLSHCTQLESLLIDEFDEHSQLTKLTARMNKLQSLQCFTCMNLTAITAEMNALKSLDCCNSRKLKILTNKYPLLEELKCWRCPVLNPQDLISFAPQLIHLEFGDPYLWEAQNYMDFIQSCEKLKVLDIATDKITTLPDRVKQLTHLTMRCANLSTLPSDMDELISLRSCSNKILSSLPRMRSLKELDLDRRCPAAKTVTAALLRQLTIAVNID